MSSKGEPRIVRLEDERDPVTRRALELIVEAIGDVQPIDDLLSEIEEGRRGMYSGGGYHLLAMLDAEGLPAAAGAGIYLRGINAGFVTYLAVRADQRRRMRGQALRRHLVDSIRGEARRLDGRDPAWTVGEVRRTSPWLRTLVRAGKAIPFDFPYLHPWMARESAGRYVLYREPVSDPRPELPAEEVARIVFGIWRRAYRIRFPLRHELFRYMLEEIEARGTVGVHPDFREGAPPVARARRPR
jgi:hypothetical protein